MRLAERVRPSPRVIAVLFFIGSATFVWWRTTQVAVLVDLSYIVNIAMAVARGDVPYRDFPLVNAPLEFVIQALLIKLLGPHWQIQIAYTSLAGGTATVFAFLIARRLLVELGSLTSWLAGLLTLPLIPLGNYAILPNPFYDPDACLAVLVAIWLLLRARERPTAPRLATAGAATTVALFIGQNIGGAFLVGLGGVLAVEAWARPALRYQFAWVVIGQGAALVSGLGILQLTAGLDNVLRWTWTFALSGRGLAFERVHQFFDPAVLLSAVLVALTAVAAPRLSAGARQLAAVTALVMLAAHVWPASVVGPPLLFPPLLWTAAALAFIRTTRDGPSLQGLLPLVLMATTLGTLDSQGLGPSSFGIFALLALGLACVIRDFVALVPSSRRLAQATGAAIAIALTVIGGAYTVGNIPLRFIDVDASGPAVSATFPSLYGLSARGPYVADLDAILFWMRDHVPPEDGFVFLPGEDPAYFALMRKPALPSVYFYDVATPYTPAEIAAIADRVGLRWVFVKDRLQLRSAPPLEPELELRLTAGATLVDRVGPYRIYRR